MNTSGVCLQGTTVYSGEVCRNELMSLQACFSGVQASLTVPSTINQKQGENDATQLLTNLPLLRPGPECEVSIRPFLCLHIFGLCDTERNYHTTLRAACAELRDNKCVSEWAMAVQFLPPGSLPVCENLPNVTEECIGIISRTCIHSTYN